MGAEQVSPLNGVGFKHKRSHRYTGKTPDTEHLSKFWGEMYPILSPGISPLASFLWHPSFHTARLLSKFAVWEEKGITLLCSLGAGSCILSQDEMENNGRIMHALTSV